MLKQSKAKSVSNSVRQSKKQQNGARCIPDSAMLFNFGQLAMLMMFDPLYSEMQNESFFRKRANRTAQRRSA